jgi:hypothetical protein
MALQDVIAKYGSSNAGRDREAEQELTSVFYTPVPQALVQVGVWGQNLNEHW